MSEKPLKVTGISSIQEDYYAALEAEAERYRQVAREQRLVRQARAARAEALRQKRQGGPDE